MKKLMLVVVLVVAVGLGWRWQRGGEPAESANRLFADRIWIDHVPRSETDAIHVFIAISEHATGIFNQSSQWRGSYELFRYEANGSDLRLVYPQTGTREAVRAKARRCKEREMDYCLELTGASRGVKQYYSREGWEIKGAQALDAANQRIEALRDQLRASAQP